MKKIAVITQKGGVGKSAVSANTAYELAEYGSTLLADIDAQAHSCEIFRGDKVPTYTVKDLFSDPKMDPTKAIEPAYVKGERVKNLDVIHSNILFSKVAEQVSSRIHREKILHNHLRKLDYKYVIIDCPPNLGVVTINAIHTADIILIPVNYDKGALDGMADLMETIKEVKETSSFSYLVIRNEYDIRNKQTNAYVENELEPFKNILLKTKIRRSESINQSRIAGEPVQVFDPASHGAIDYKNLMKELAEYV
jgi:chromosome partitioning protein